jgi:hypothetical protein
LPETRLQVRVGGEGAPEHGTDFAALAQLAAEFRAGIRFNDTGSDYVGRFAITRWIDTAARIAGVPISHEASGDITDAGLLARIYNAAPAAVRGLKEDATWFDRPETFDTWLQQSRLFRGWPTTTEVALLYPQAHVSLFGGEFLNREFLPLVREMRSQFDFDMVSERMIANSALEKYRALVLGGGDIWDRATLDKVAAWVRGGGLLIAPLRIDQGLLYPELLKAGPRSLGSGRLVLGNDGSDYPAFVRATLASQPFLTSANRESLAAGDPDLGLFATSLTPAGLLLLNAADAPISREIALGGRTRNLTLPPQSIVPVAP